MALYSYGPNVRVEPLEHLHLVRAHAADELAQEVVALFEERHQQRRGILRLYSNGLRSYGLYCYGLVI